MTHSITHSASFSSFRYSNSLKHNTPPPPISPSRPLNKKKSSILNSLTRRAREVLNLPEIRVVSPFLYDEVLAELNGNLEHQVFGEESGYRHRESNVPLETLSCGICFDSFCVPSSPSSSASPTSTSSDIYLDSETTALRLPCPASHSYCIQCLRGYLRASLDQVVEVGRKHGLTTSVRCPECPLSSPSAPEHQDSDNAEEHHPTWEFEDELVGMILTGEDLDRWVRGRLLPLLPGTFA